MRNHLKVRQIDRSIRGCFQQSTKTRPLWVLSHRNQWLITPLWRQTLHTKLNKDLAKDPLEILHSATTTKMINQTMTQKTSILPILRVPGFSDCWTRQGGWLSFRQCTNQLSKRSKQWVLLEWSVHQQPLLNSSRPLNRHSKRMKKHWELINQER